MGMTHAPRRIPMPSTDHKQKGKRLNCKNCGAPLPDWEEGTMLYADDQIIFGDYTTKCAYCGTCTRYQQIGNHAET